MADHHRRGCAALAHKQAQAVASYAAFAWVSSITSHTLPKVRVFISPVPAPAGVMPAKDECGISNLVFLGSFRTPPCRDLWIKSGPT